MTDLPDWLLRPTALIDLLPIAVMAALLAAALMAAFGASRNLGPAPEHRSDDAPWNRLARWMRRMRLSPGMELALYGLLTLVVVLFVMALALAFTLIGGALVGAFAGGGDLQPTSYLGLGALVVALLGAPFLIWRSVVAQRTLETTQDGLVTERINAAVESLGAEKEVNRIGRSVHYKLEGRWRTEFEWQDDRFEFPDKAEFDPEDKPGDLQNIAVTVPNMEVRVGAILALGRIARENLSFHVQIMQILCAYVRENAPASDEVQFKAPTFPVNDMEDELTLEDVEAYKKELDERLQKLRASLPTPRTDIQTALDVLGRRNRDQKGKEGAWPDPEGSAPNIFDTPFPEPPPYPEVWTAEGHAKWRREAYRYSEKAARLRHSFFTVKCYRLDLRNTNLQGYAMNGLDLRGAMLGGAQMQRARLVEAQMQGAGLVDAQMQWAALDRAEMQGAWLGGAEMQGAWLGGARMSEDTDLSAATLRGAALRSVDATTIAHLRPFWDEIFADGTVREHVPEEVRPAHWRREELDYKPWDPDTSPFHIAWHEWLSTLPPAPGD